MKVDTIELLNTILKITYEFGWEVGASWDPEHYKRLLDPSGYLNDDMQITKDLHENISKLLAKLGYNSEDYNIYTKEDCSIHENDWDYIAPVLKLKNKEID